MSNSVTLTRDEESRALEVAEQRQSSSEKRGDQNRYGAKKNRTRQDNLNIHHAGCRGEIAAAKVYGVTPHLHVDTFKDVPDIGSNGEVRCRKDDSWDLIIRENDSADRYYILVIGDAASKELRVAGGISGVEAKKHPEWVKDHGGHGPAWFVPQAALEFDPSQVVN